MLHCPTRSLWFETVFLLGSGFLVFACASQPRPAQSSSPGQSYAAAIRQICEVDSHIAPEENDNELEQGQLREDYILAHTENPDAIYFVTLWRTKPPEEQARSLREEAKAQGLGECALTEALAPQG